MEESAESAPVLDAVEEAVPKIKNLERSPSPPQDENEAPQGQAMDKPSSLHWAPSRFSLPAASPQTSAAMSGGGGYQGPDTPASQNPSPRASDGSSFLTRPPPLPSNEHQISSQKSWARRVQSRTNELRHLFSLDATEQLVDDYLCALRKKVLLQGRLFVFEHHLCFYSSLFGYHKAKVVPLAAVHDISKKKNVGFPNSIQVVWDAGSAGVKKEFFTSFLSREDAYRLLLGLWGRCSEIGRERAAAVLGPGTEDDENRSGLSKRWSKWSRAAPALTAVATAPAAISATPLEEAERDERNSDSSGSATGLTPTGAQAEEATSCPFPWPPGLPPVAHHEVATLSDGDELPGRQSILPGTSVREFEEVCCDPSTVAKEFNSATEAAPPLPATVLPVLKCNLPTTPLGFWRAFLCPTSDFFVAFHERQGHHSIELSPWQSHFKVGPVRDLRFVTPLKGWRIGPPQALCHQTQRFQIFKDSHLVFETSQVMNDIPYGDHFRVDQRWDVTSGPSPGTCALEVHVAVPFTKSTVWKKVIEKSVTQSTLEAFNMFKDLAFAQLAELDNDGEAAGGAVAGTPGPGPKAGGMPHRRTPSRPTSPEEALPASNVEWEALLAQVDPQWRGGLRALRRSQIGAADSGGEQQGGGILLSPLPGGTRHRRRGSRVPRSIDASAAGAQFGSPMALARVPEGTLGEEAAAADGAAFAAASGAPRSFSSSSFLGQRGPVLLLCLLCSVIIGLQLTLLYLQFGRAAAGGAEALGGVSQAAPAAAGVGGSGDLAQEVSWLATEFQRLQREAQEWSTKADALSAVADRIVRSLQAGNAGSSLA